LRRSRVHRHLVPDHSGPGLSECLAGAADPATTIVRVGGAPNLDVLPAGHRPPNPSELLDSDSMRSLLAKWSGQYDHIIIDTPPVLGFADAIAPASMVDAVLIVARAHQTTRQSLVRARDLLSRVHARVIGVVMNDVNPKSSDYYDYYGYSSKYAKYYRLQ
jgi:polysaccharide biosynthesis transport protein